jgi:hypothetical protein
MHVSRPSRAWRWTTICLCLFVLSLLAPSIWRGVRLVPGALVPGARPDSEEPVKGVQGEAAESLPSLPRLDAYVTPELRGGEEGDIAEAAAIVPEEFAGRVGQSYAAESATEAAERVMASHLQEVTPPAAAEDYVGVTHGEPADVAAQRTVMPTALLSQLEAISAQPGCRAWAARTTELVHAHLSAGSHEAAGVALDDLEKQIRALDKILAEADGKPQAAPLRRLQHALVRRADVWKAVLDLRARPLAVAATAPSDKAATLAKEIASAIGEVERFMSQSEHGTAWSRFLLLPELRAVVESPSGPQTEAVAAASHRTLGRFDYAATSRQRKYLRQAPLHALKNALLRATDEPIDTPCLLTTLEAYEADGKPSHAEELAGAIGRLLRSTRTEDLALGRRLAWHYRGTNLRFAVSEELLSRFLPRETEPMLQSVSDTIMGVPVSGQSLTHNELRVRLLRSHGDVVRVLLEAQGTVASDTFARSGSVSTQSHTDGQYRVSKLVDLQSDGIHAHPVQIESISANSQLQNMSTEWDSVPLIGDMVRSIASRRYESSEGQRQSEVEGKMARRIVSQFDRRAMPMLARLDQNFAKRVLTPLGRLELQPEAVVDRPADERMNVRLRVAAEHQLSGHTPRPRALVNSLASLQVHESLINNVLEQLHLDGRSMTASQLVNHINEQLNVRLKCNAEKGGKLTFTFAEQDALHVRLADDCMLLTVSIARLDGGDRQWTDFQIVVPYAFKPSGASIQLVQTDEPSLLGRLSNRSQMILQGILTNFFDSDEKFDLLSSVFDAQRFGDAKIAQVVVTDGWLGLSLTQK